MIVRTAIFLMVLLVSKVLKAGPVEQYCNEALPKTTPSERFIIDYEKETVLDTKTGLMWKRCLEGKSGADCGVVSFPIPEKRLQWDRANEIALSSRHAGYDDWRLPTANELKNVVERTCTNPAINLVVFPGTSSTDVWASSPFITAGRFVRYWYVDFKAGIMNADPLSASNTVRLVRTAR